MISESIETRERTRFFSAFYFRPHTMRDTRARGHTHTYTIMQTIAAIIASPGCNQDTVARLNRRMYNDREFT